MKPRNTYHTIIFAPDTWGDDGPLVQQPVSGYHGLGTQTTLPIPDPEPILYDHNDQAIYFQDPRPAKKRIGFRK